METKKRAHEHFLEDIVRRDDQPLNKEGQLPFDAHIRTSLVKYLDVLRNCPEEELAAILNFDNIELEFGCDVSYDDFEKGLSGRITLSRNFLEELLDFNWLYELHPNIGVRDYTAIAPNKAVIISTKLKRDACKCFQTEEECRKHIGKYFDRLTLHPYGGGGRRHKSGSAYCELREVLLDVGEYIVSNNIPCELGMQSNPWRLKQETDKEYLGYAFWHIVQTADERPDKSLQNV